MTSQEIISAIHGNYHTGGSRGLDNIRTLEDLLGPWCTMPVVHVAGTNGKGSTCAMLESVLRRAGKKTGLYTSPFLQYYQERIRIAGEPVGDGLLIPCGERVLAAAQKLRAEGIEPTPFELGTALALTVFEAAQVDIAIVEVGLGGRLDPTNVVRPSVCAIAAIGLDHMAFLGDTVEKIAAEKAGIIKPGVPVCVHPAEEGTAAVFTEAARKAVAPLRLMTGDSILNASSDARGCTADLCLNRKWERLRIGLPGRHQLTNALTALAVLEELEKQGLQVPEAAVREGLEQVRWPARLEWRGSVLLDGAHNAQGVAALESFVRENLWNSRRILLTGILEDKAGEDMLRTLGSMVDCVVTVTPDSPRAIPAVELAARFRGLGFMAQSAPGPEQGIRLARELAGENGKVIAAGSLYLMGQLRSLLD